MTTVERVDGDDVISEVGEEGMVAPVRPQPLLGGVGEPGAAHDQPARRLSPPAAGGVSGVGDLRLSADRVVDVDPRGVGDRRDRCSHRLHAAAHGHRVAHVQASQGGDGVVGPEPRIDPHGERAGSAGASHPGDQLVDEPAGATLRVGLPLAHPGVQHLTAVGAGGEDRVVAEHFRVAEPGALLVLAGDLADRRIDVDHEWSGSGTGAGSPDPLECAPDDGFELADMTEREGSQKRAQRRGRHHPMAQHPGGRTGAQHVGVINVRRAGDHRVDQRQHLAPRTSTTDPTQQAHRRVDQRLQPEPLTQRGHEQQTGVGDQVRLIEDDLNAVNAVRYSRHWKCLLAWLQRRRRTPSLSQLRRPFSWMRELPHAARIGGSRLKRRAGSGSTGGNASIDPRSSKIASAGRCLVVAWMR